MKQLILDAKEVVIFQYQEYREYASESVSGKRLRLMVNLFGRYRVVWGIDTLYSGNNIFNAIESFNTMQPIGD